MREAFAHWYIALPLTVVLILVMFPGDEGTPLFWQFVAGMMIAPLLCALLIKAWRHNGRGRRAERIITHADGRQARVDAATGKGYQPLEAQEKRDDFLTWLGKRV